MKKITLSIAAAVLATGIASTASATVPSDTAPVFTMAVRGDGIEPVGYWYRYRCYYFRYGHRIYRRCYVRWYYR